MKCIFYIPVNAFRDPFVCTGACVFTSLSLPLPSSLLPPPSSSAELQKPSPGQPSIPEVVELVMKECKKESLVYKMAALRSAGDVLQSTKQDRFSDMADILIPLIRKVSYPHPARARTQPPGFDATLVAFHSANLISQLCI